MQISKQIFHHFFAVYLLSAVCLTATSCQENPNSAIKSKVLSRDQASAPQNSNQPVSSTADADSSQTDQNQANQDSTGSSGNPTQVSTNLAILKRLLLAGNWEKNCIAGPASKPGEFEKSFVSVSGATITTTTASYSDSTCADALKIEEKKSTYLITVVDSDESIVKVDRKLSKLERTPFTDVALGSLKAIDPNATLGSPSAVSFTPARVYDIIGVQNRFETFCFGDKSADKTGSTPELRPTTLTNAGDCYSHSRLQTFINLGFKKSWRIDCRADTETKPGSFVKKYVNFSGLYLRKTSVYFSDSACTISNVIEQTTSRYLLEEVLINGSTAILDLKMTEFTLSASSQESLNKLKVYVPNAAFGTSYPIPFTPSSIFDRAGLVADQMCLGNKTGTQNGSTAALRPTSFDVATNCYDSF